MGDEPNTIQRLHVVSVDPEQNLMLIKGSVPGPIGSCVRIYKTTRPKRVSKVAPAKAKVATKKAAKPAAPAKK